MTQIFSILLFILSAFTSYLISVSSLSNFIPQIIALVSVVFIFLSLFKKSLSLHLIAFIISLIIFYTQGLTSPFFFLIYFLLFTVSFQNPPTVTLSLSLTLILLLGQSLDSLNSLIPLASLLLITPLSWFISKQYLDKNKVETDITVSETNVLMWLSLKFKTGISQIIDNCSELLSSPLTPTQKDQVKYIKASAKYLLNSSEKLKDEVDHQSDDEN